MTARRRLLWLAAVCGVVFVAIAILFVGTRAGQRVDDAALEGRTARNPEAVARARDVLQTISVGSVALGGSALMLAAAAQKNVKLVVTVVLVLAGSVGLAELLKHVVITRPDLITTPYSRGDNTFPSGHTATAASLAVAALLIAPARWRSWVGIGGALYAAAVGASTLTAGSHRPSDAVGSIVLAVGVGALGAASLTSGSDPPAASRGGRAAGRGLAVTGALLLAAGSAVGAAYVLTTRYKRLQVVTLGRANVAAAGAIVGAALLLFGLLLVAMRSE